MLVATAICRPLNTVTVTYYVTLCLVLRSRRPVDLVRGYFVTSDARDYSAKVFLEWRLLVGAGKKRLVCVLNVGDQGGMLA